MELFKIQFFFLYMRGAGTGTLFYTYQVKVSVHIQFHFAKANRKCCVVLVGCEVAVYSVVNDLTTDLL